MIKKTDRSESEKVAVISGAGIRIGKQIAKDMLRSGYRVILHACANFEKLRRWTTEFELSNQVIGIFQADLSTSIGQKKFCQECLSLTAKIDVLVHNASYYRERAFSAIDRSEYRKMQSINLEAPFFITQNLLPLIEESRLSCVFNILDAMWERPSKKYSHYFVSKAGLAILTRSLACELAPRIRVNAIAPGAIVLQEDQSQAKAQRILRKIPLNRFGNPSELGQIIIFLAEKAHYLTGQIINIDGGRSISS